jgi:hypothetical protein
MNRFDDVQVVLECCVQGFTSQLTYLPIAKIPNTRFAEENVWKMS